MALLKTISVCGECSTQEELDKLTDLLNEKTRELMVLGYYSVGGATISSSLNCTGKMVFSLCLSMQNHSILPIEIGEEEPLAP